jgi:hypothetical protein
MSRIPDVWSFARSCSFGRSPAPPPSAHGVAAIAAGSGSCGGSKSRFEKSKLRPMLDA